ncbi:hypothetical protein IAD21_03157 [Abditibacteriota bacterium]|nr:hypothetical protein IAD21_03157 [Abditibacteriota bacterium]
MKSSKGAPVNTSAPLLLLMFLTHLPLYFLACEDEYGYTDINKGEISPEGDLIKVASVQVGDPNIAKPTPKLKNLE